MEKGIHEADVHGLKAGSILTINVSSPHTHFEAYSVLNALPSEGVCVTLNRTANNLQRMIQQHGLDTRKLHFVDAVTVPIQDTRRMDGCSYVPDPRNLADLASLIERAVQGMKPGDKFVIVDCFHDLGYYHDEHTIIQFLDFLTQRLKVLRLKGIFLIDQNRLSRKVKKRLFEVSDKMVYV